MKKLYSDVKKNWKWSSKTHVQHVTEQVQNLELLRRLAKNVVEKVRLYILLSPSLEPYRMYRLVRIVMEQGRLSKRNVLIVREQVMWQAKRRYRYPFRQVSIMDKVSESVEKENREQTVVQEAICW